MGCLIMKEFAFICKVAKVDSSLRLILNKGYDDGIKGGMRFLIYEVSKEDIIDPDTHAILGKLEIVKGTGKVVHTQQRISTLESDMYLEPPPRKIVRTSNKDPYGVFLHPFKETVEEVNLEPKEKIEFDSPKVGDFAKQIS